MRVSKYSDLVFRMVVCEEINFLNDSVELKLTGCHSNSLKIMQTSPSFGLCLPPGGKLMNI